MTQRSDSLIRPGVDQLGAGNRRYCPAQPFPFARLIALWLVLAMLLTGKKVVRWEGAVLLLIYFGYTAFLYWPQ